VDPEYPWLNKGNTIERNPMDVEDVEQTP